MIFRTLGRTGLRVSLAGLGTGGASQLGQSTGRTAAESHRVVHKAIDLGINLFDSSSGYRNSEELLGAALKGIPRHRYVIATKFRPGRQEPIEAPESLMAQLEESLRRLKVDCIDVFQYHAVMPNLYHQIIERFHEIALRAQEAGKIRYIGITETVGEDGPHEMLETALEEDLFDTLMIKHGILNQSGAAKVLPMALERNVGVFVMASVRTSLRSAQEACDRINGFIDEGLLSIPRPTLADPLGLANAGGAVPTLTKAAYQFSAAHEAVSSVLVGTGNPEHLKTNVADILSTPLSQAQMAYLQRTYAHLNWTK